MAILNYTTQIDYHKTISEIQKILASNGAKKIVIDNNDNGIPVAMTFSIFWKESYIGFCLPCNFKNIYLALKKDSRVPKKLRTEEQAVRVGWRIIKDWVAAQMAIVQSELATMTEIFLPYAITAEGRTLYKFIENNQHLMLKQ